MRRLAPLLALMLLACAREDRTDLHVRPISAPAAQGWARLPLDAPAQRHLEGAWIGDASGRSVPFLLAREGLWNPQPLALENLMLGKDAEGRPGAEFTLKLPEGWQVGEREHLRLDLDLEGKAPWVAELRAERSRDGGAFLAHDFPSPPHLYDLAPSGSRSTVTLPWDGQRYRLALKTTQGEAPRIKGLRAFAETRPEALETELALEASLQAVEGPHPAWRLDLPMKERVVGLELVLTPPAAPLRVDLQWEDGDRITTTSDLLWNLPALDTKATWIALAPTLTRTVTVHLPQGATLESARVLVRRQTLIFPAQAGQSYALHLGGRPRPAPGNLGALPSCRALFAGAALSLGAEAPDPLGLPRRIESGERARPWMPWAAGAAVLILGFFAWRLLKEG